MPGTMATPTLSMAALASSGKAINNGKCPNGSALNGHEANSKHTNGSDKHDAPVAPVGKSTGTIKGKPDHAKPTQPPTDSRARRHVTEEVNEDSIYCICLKKITYTFNNSLNKQANSSNYVTRCDQVDCSRGSGEKTNSKWYDDQQVGSVFVSLGSRARVTHSMPLDCHTFRCCLLFRRCCHNHHWPQMSALSLASAQRQTMAPEKVSLRGHRSINQQRARAFRPFCCLSIGHSNT